MQDQIEILKFEKTEDQKFIGIVTIRLFRQVVLKYKIVENKDGSGFFVAPPSYKLEVNGQDKWSSWHMLDSQVFSEEVQDMIRAYVLKCFKQNSNKPSPSVFNESQQTIPASSPAQQNFAPQSNDLPF